MAFLSKVTFEVMVIDDQPSEKIIVDEILRDSGFITLWCSDWNEAKSTILERIDKSIMLPDIVIVDMHFHGDHCVIGTNPSMEGVFIIREFIETCKSRNLEPPPVIGFTGKEYYLEPEEILVSGAIDFITGSEFNDQKYFARRLMQSVLESQLERSFEPQPTKNIEHIEEDIVSKALKKHQNDLRKTAEYLRWPMKEVKTVADRLVDKGAF